MAQKLGINQQRLSHLERGVRQPNTREMEALLKLLGPFPGHVAPQGVFRRLSENGRRCRPRLAPFRPCQDRPNYIRYFAALSQYPNFVQSHAARIKGRQDFTDCQHLCSQIASGSADEVLVLLRLLGRGAIPGLCPPASLGRLPHAIVDPATRDLVGHRQFPCLHFEGDFFFFQVSFSTPRIFTVDILRWKDEWSVIEVDGLGHSNCHDETKTAAIGLKTKRLTTEEILSKDFIL